MLPHCDPRFPLWQQQARCGHANPACNLVPRLRGTDCRLFQMSRRAGKMIQDFGPVFLFIRRQQIGRPRRHVQKSPGAVGNIPCRFARFIRMGRQPFIRNRRCNRRAFSPIGRRTQVPQPVKTVNIFEKGGGQRRVCVVARHAIKIHAHHMKTVHPDRFAPCFITSQRIDGRGKQLYRLLSRNPHPVQRRAPAQLIEHQRCLGDQPLHTSGRAQRQSRSGICVL